METTNLFEAHRLARLTAKESAAQTRRRVHLEEVARGTPIGAEVGDLTAPKG